MPAWRAYSATKAGLIGMVKSAGKDYAETGITINALAPAVIRTDMVAAMPEHQVKYMTDKIPMKRTGELDEAAAMIDLIVSAGMLLHHRLHLRPHRRPRHVLISTGLGRMSPKARNPSGRGENGVRRAPERSRTPFADRPHGFQKRFQTAAK